jgi:hypothetical protein
MPDGQITGTWRLTSIRFEYADTGEQIDMYGANPLGFLVLTEDGRMMALVTSADRAPPSTDADTAALFQSMMAYTGEYRIEADRFVTSIDVAWHPAWNGTEQTRFFELGDNGTLLLTTPPQTHPLFPGHIGRGVISWCRGEIP